MWYNGYKKNISTMSNLVEQLKEYLENTPKEELDKEWESLKYLNDIGPSVDEYIETWTNNYMNTYLTYRFNTNNHNKYRKYCNEWIKNITKEQMDYFYEEARRLNFKIDKYIATLRKKSKNC